MDIYDPFDDDINIMTQLRGNNLGPIQKNAKEVRDDLQTIIDSGQLMNILPLKGKGFKKLNSSERSKKLSSSVKILTPNQMLARLPILLVQIQAGNNSQQLKNERRQLLYSLYKSQKINKSIYKKLIDSI